MKTRHEGLLKWLRHATDKQVASTGTTRAYLKQIGYGHKPASPEIAVRVEAASDGAATRQSLRPSDWHVLWPELLSPDTPKVIPDRATATTPWPGWIAIQEKDRGTR